MSSAHHSRSWYSISKQLRAVWKVDQQNGQLVCGRCGRFIEPGTAFDVGHIVDAAIAELSGWDAAAINDRANLRPEHRKRTVDCIGNNVAGGRLSQQLKQQRTASDQRLWRV